MDRSKGQSRWPERERGSLADALHATTLAFYAAMSTPDLLADLRAAIVVSETADADLFAQTVEARAFILAELERRHPERFWRWFEQDGPLQDLLAALEP